MLSSAWPQEWKCFCWDWIQSSVSLLSTHEYSTIKRLFLFLNFFLYVPVSQANWCNMFFVTSWLSLPLMGVTWVKLKLGFKPRPPAWEADNQPTELSLLPVKRVLSGNEMYWNKWEKFLEIVFIPWFTLIVAHHFHLSNLLNTALDCHSLHFWNFFLTICHGICKRTFQICVYGDKKNSPQGWWLLHRCFGWNTINNL